ncbi:TVP38/TMEM64 family protein [Corynebacterium poyangense]|uniref:TVP38/TMEM64 family protein n=1 Tax=Corynebacterium poyangense TaxID=2684405 RepID=UPI00165D2C70|nr:TVP38/TMEM64 family protein [Corynebacterium poyangense]
MNPGSLYDFLRSLFRDSRQAIARWSLARKIIVVSIIVLGITATCFFHIPSLATLRLWATQWGPSFPLIFWLSYIIITQFPIPRTLLTLSSGILFGPFVGIVIALSATATSAALSLSIVRALLGDWIEPRLTHPAVATINARLQQRGWLAVTSLRMIAGVPFSILNYVTALTSIPLVPFIIATFIGSAPGTILTVFLGDTLTGSADPRMVIATTILAMLGLCGLILDSRMAVKAIK